MAFKIEIEGDSEEAIALALLEMVARAEGKMDGDGAIRGADRDWILDTYAECLMAVVGIRPVGEEEEDDEDEEEDEEDEEEDEDER